jgi:hypothetical protein
MCLVLPLAVKQLLYVMSCIKVVVTRLTKKDPDPPPPTATRAEAYAGGLCAAATVSFLRGPVSPRPPAS